MHPFEFTRPDCLSMASRTAAVSSPVSFIAGGTDLLQLMKDEVSRPRRLIGITGLSELSGIELTGERLRLGALARMSDVADNGGVRTGFPALAEALLASASPQVRNLAARQARTSLISLAVGTPGGILSGTNAAEIELKDGFLFRKERLDLGEPIGEVMARAGRDSLEERSATSPDEDPSGFSTHAFGAHFVEVRVDPDFGEVRIGRYVGAFAAGRILNPKTARSQLIGGIVFGLGMALTEETEVDARTGRIVNQTIADYLVPVHADVPDIEVLFVDEPDGYVNPMGAKGIGELPVVGVAAAVANAVYHATGKRVRDLPVRPDRLIGQDRGASPLI